MFFKPSSLFNDHVIYSQNLSTMVSYGGIIKVAFVDKWPLFRASETTYPIFTGQIKTGLCRQETTIRRCCYAQVWLYVEGCYVHLCGCYLPKYYWSYIPVIMSAFTNWEYLSISVTTVILIVYYSFDSLLIN